MMTNEYDYEQEQAIDGLVAGEVSTQLEYAEEGLNLNLFVITGWLVSVLIALGCYVVGAKFFAAAVMGLWVAAVTIVSPRAGIIVVLAIQVWDVAMNPEVGGAYERISAGRILSILAVISYLRYVITGRMHIRACKRSLLLLAIFVLWGVASISWAQLPALSIRSISKIIIQLALTVAGIDLLSQRKVLRQIFVLMTIGGVTGGIFVLFGGITIRGSTEARLALAGVGANALAVSLGVCMLAAIGLLLFKKSALYLTIATVSAIGMMLVAFRAGTRSVVIGIPMAVMFGAILGYWRKAHKLFLVALIGLTFTGLSLFYAIRSGFISGELLDRILTVFHSEMYGENLRWALWSKGLKLYASHPLGFGAGNEIYAYGLIGGVGDAMEAHNVLVSVLIQYNIVGLGIFVAAMATIAIALVRVRDPALRCVAGMFFFFCLLSAMKGTIHETRVFWQPLMLGMMAIEADFREQQRSRLEDYSDENIDEFD